MIDIVHGGPSYSSIIPGEAHGLDKVDSRAKTSTEAQNGADVSSDFGFEKGNAHSGSLAPGTGPRKSAMDCRLPEPQFDRRSATLALAYGPCNPLPGWVQDEIEMEAGAWVDRTW
jgi:hypothetical protein